MSKTSGSTNAKKFNLVGRLLAMAALLIVGWFIARSHAATANIAAEAESGQRSANAVVCGGASGEGASGAQAVKFGVSDCTTSGRTYTNPVKQSTADPGAFAWGGKYYMVSTSGNPSFNIFVSDDMANWQWANAAVFDGTHPWGKDRFWAPELHRVNNKFYVYYSAGDATGRMKIGVATADTITGPYKDLGRPIVSDAAADVIDINYFQDDTGKQYLYWKNNASSQIYVQEVAADGITLVGTAKSTLQPSLAWEGGTLEGSWTMKKDGQYYIFYSGNWFNSDKYGVGVARSASPLGPWTKKGDPILKSGNRWKGPGHNSVLSTNGGDYMLYHAWDRVPEAGDRIGLLDKITWSNGWPSVANGTPTETAQPLP